MTEVRTQAEGDAPVRVQLRRTKGWRMPANTVKVDRTTRWGNPHRPEDWRENWPFRETSIGEVGRDGWCRDRAIEAFIQDMRDGALLLDISALRGKNLACWCRLGEPCHADILLELANASTPERTKVVSQASGQDRVEPSNPSNLAAGGEP